jgi:hypothetical protein
VPILTSTPSFFNQPDGDVYFFLISLDNSGGFGSGHFVISGDGEYRGKAPFIAAWSDAIHDPPAELARLFSRVLELESTSKFRLNSIIENLGYNIRHPATDKLFADLEKEIEFPDGSKYRLIDLLAVQRYQQLQGRKAGSRKPRNPVGKQDACPTGRVLALRACRFLQKVNGGEVHHHCKSPPSKFILSCVSTFSGSGRFGIPDGRVEIEPVEIHDLVPRGDEIANEFPVRIAAGVDFGEGS